MLSEEKEVLDYIKKAFSLRAKKLYKPAVEMLYKAIDLDNDNEEVLYQLGELRYLLNNNQRAIGYLEQVLNKRADHLESLNLIREIKEKSGEYEDALYYAERLYALSPNSVNLKNIVRLFGRLKNTKVLAKCQKEKYCNEEVLYEIANAFYKNGETKEAKEILESDNKSEEMRILLGKIYFDENNLKASREIFSCFDRNTENPEVLNYKGLFALEDMEFTEAIKYFSRASHINGNNPVYCYNLANAYFFNGWMEEAQKSYSKAIYLDPENSDYRYSLAYLYYEIKAYDKCKKETEVILSNNPQHYRTRVLKALLLNIENDYIKAKEILEENYSQDPEDDFNLISLAKTYSHLDMFIKAEQITKKAVDKNPDNINYISDLADLYIQEKEFDKAIELSQRLIDLNPKYIYGYILSAKIAYIKGDYSTAKKYAQESLLLDINCSQGYYYLALVRLEEEDLEEAVECLKRAITYDLNNPEYYAKMSEIYEKKGDVKTAFDYISEAVSIDDSTRYKAQYKKLASSCRKNK